MAIKFLNTVAVDTDVLYVDAANNRVGIGTTSPSTKLDVQGVVTIKGSGTGTSGSLAIQDDYSGENHLGNIGWIRSSGGVYLSYGLKQENSAEWKSTYANFSGERAYAKLDNNEFSMAHAPAQNTAVGTAVTGLTERFKFYLNTGVLQLNSYSAGILSTNSSGTVGLASSGDLPGGPYLPLSAGSSYPLTGTLYGTSTNFSGNGDYAGSMTLGTGASTAEANLQIGQGRTGNGYSYIDLIGDATYTDYGLRIIRNNTGANTSSAIIHRGTGNLEISSVESSSTLFKTNNTTVLTLTNTQRVGIGTTSPSEKLEVIGRTKITKSGDALRINSSDANGPYVTWQNNGSNIGYIGSGYHLWSSPNNIATSLGIRAQTRLDLGVQANVHMTILNNGNVGVGTTSPARKLEVYNGSSSMISQFRSGSGTSSFICFANTGSIADQVRIGSISTNLVLSTNYTERMRITSTGNVGIGTTSPSGLLHVHQTGSGTSNSIITEDDARKIFIGRDSIKATDLSDNAAMLYLQQNGGNATFGNDLSIGGNLTLTSNARYLRTEDSAGATTRLLGINGSNTTYIGPIDAYAGGSVFYGVSANVSSHTLYTGASARLHVNSSGNVGIGTTAPSQKLHVAGNMRLQNQLYDSTNSLGSNNQVLTKVSAGTQWKDAPVNAQMPNNTAPASAANVGTIRYRSTSNTSFVDVSMQTGATTYTWVNIVSNFW